MTSETELKIQAMDVDVEKLEISDDLKRIGREIGRTALIKLILANAGLPIYVSVHAKTALKKAFLRANYNGSNARQLALLLGVTVRTIQNWLDERQMMKVQQRVEQLSLLG